MKPMVRQRFRRFVNHVLAALIALMASAPMVAVHAQAAAVPEGPEQLVLRVSNDVLNAIKATNRSRAAIRRGCKNWLTTRCCRNVDFEKMTRLAVGRGWRQATPEQQQTLLREFRVLLVRTYAGAVSQVRDVALELSSLASLHGVRSYMPGRREDSAFLASPEYDAIGDELDHGVDASCIDRLGERGLVVFECQTPTTLTVVDLPAARSFRHPIVELNRRLSPTSYVGSDTT